ncbi:YggT family protein [Aciduricibacillus chroicocephali]|uniref:YggT family protein n=1 Tax=Aciduricibacillus chroicocephali TaxID=3054939 RepID=A0ABY9KY12_9BACI|nr:YggT family protein [Bacillaceae bacterium 44XB]
MDMLINVLGTALRLYSYAIIVYILLSWFPGARDSAFGHFLARICEPFLEPFRKIIPPIGMIDFSAFVAIIVLNLAQMGLQQLYFMLG